MATAVLEANEMLEVTELESIVEEFYREGCAIVRNVLSAEECHELRARADLRYRERGGVDNVFAKMVLREICALDGEFRNMLVREPMLGLARSILGADCRYCGSNIIRSGRDEAIDQWHVDMANAVEFPLPPDVPRHDPRIRMPVQWMTFQIALSDIDRHEDGPTQYVPESHYSGRDVPTQDDPHFEGRGPVDLLCRAGDMYLTNHQTWHRGAPNRSGRIRYLLQLQYGKGWAVRRFNGYIEQVVEGMRLDGSLRDAGCELMNVLATNRYSV